jgi:threonine/homoserine/homoserine lactone efflux protein
MNFLFKGLLIGFAIAAPVGPIGVLCIRRTLADGRAIGFISGLGAATADMSYGAVAAFGLTAAQNILTGLQFWLRVIGGIFLIYLGARTLVSKSAQQPQQNPSQRGLFPAYLSTLGLTLTNPATILSFASAFVVFGLGDTSGHYVSAGLLTAGVLVGSAAWWLALSSLVGAFRERFTPAWMTWVNRLSGTIIGVFGVIALATLR